MKRRIPLLSFSTLLLSSTLSHLRAAPQPSPSPSTMTSPRVASPAPARITKDVAQILSWLPANTESLLVAQGPFVTPLIPEDQQPTLEPPPLFWTFGGLLASPYEPVLRGRTIMATVEGSRNFRAPAGLGLMPFDGCCVLLLKPDGQFKTIDEMRKVMGGAQRQQVMGYPSLVVTQKSENDYWQYYAVMPHPDMLLIASNYEYLSEVITAAKQSAANRRAFPAMLPLWKQVDTTQPFWGLRWYGANKQRAKTRDAVINDLQAIGWTFSANTKDPQQVKVRYFSPNPKGMAQVREIWNNPAEGSTPRITTPQPGILEITSVLSDPKSKFSTFFYLMGMFGHAVFV